MRFGPVHPPFRLEFPPKVKFARQRDRVDQEARTGGDKVSLELQILRELVGRDDRDSWPPAQHLFDHGGNVRHVGQIRHAWQPEGFAMRTHAIDFVAGSFLGFRPRYHGHDEGVDGHARVVAAGCHDGRGEVHGLFVVARVFYIRVEEDVADERGRGGSVGYSGFDGFPPFREDVAMEGAHVCPEAAPGLEERGKLAECREEIHPASIDGGDEFHGYPLVVVELRFGFVQWVSHDDPVEHRGGISIVVSEPQVGLPKIAAEHVNALELLHPGVDLEVRAAEQLMHHTTSLSPFLLLSYHGALPVANQITRNGHMRSLVGYLPALCYEFRDDSVRVKHNPRLGSHMQCHHLSILYQGGQLLDVQINTPVVPLMFDGISKELTQSLKEMAPRRRACIICSKFPKTGTPGGFGGIAHFFIDHFKSVGCKN